MPPGVTLTTGGVIDGTPTQPGFFSFLVRVLDSNATSPSSDTETVGINVFADETRVPIIATVRVKGSKKLHIVGQGFRADSIVLVNGTAFTPKSLESDGSMQTLFCKGKLHLGASGTNVVQVVNSDARSAPFSF